eukprot:15377096-Alexandrium_andersonii.AAC.1
MAALLRAFCTSSPLKEQAKLQQSWHANGHLKSRMKEHGTSNRRRVHLIIFATPSELIEPTQGERMSAI